MLEQKGIYPFDEIYVRLLFFTRAFFLRVNRLPQLNETVKHDKMREEPENRLLLYTVMFARAFGILCCFCLISYYIPVLPGNIVFKDAPWPCKGGGVSASPLFQQADVGKIPATLKH